MFRKSRRAVRAALMLVTALTGGAAATSALAATGEVEVVRDEWGVPHVYAERVYGLFYGYGHAVAQDRLFQMAMARRSVEGRVAAVLGQDYVDFDRRIRTGFDPASIRAQIEALSPRNHDILAGYAAGMNAWIEEVRERPGELMPLQFHEYGFMPERWSAYDVAMIFVGSMGNRFGDFNTEIDNQRLLNALVEKHGRAAGHDLFDQLIPLQSENAPTTIPRADWQAGEPVSSGQASTFPISEGVLADTQRIPLGRDGRIAALAPGSVPEYLAAEYRRFGLTGVAGYPQTSNIVVLGEARSEGAASLLLNGPQFGWYQPAYTYSVGLHGAGFDLVGNTPFAYPAILFGHNGEIAWGSTWGAGDVVDIYREALNPDDPDQYRFKGDYRDMEVRQETIAVKGGADVDITIRRTVHGPVIAMDEQNGVAYAKKRSWAGRELDTLMAWIHQGRAQDWQTWIDYAADSAFNINWYYADRDGDIGYAFTGAYPERAPDHDRRVPVDGTGSMEWRGIHEFERYNPHVLNPSSGYIANWNNKPADGPYAPDEWWYAWTEADRVRELTTRVEAAGTLSGDELWDLMHEASLADVNARYFIPLLGQAAEVLPGDDPRRALITGLEDWNALINDGDDDGLYDGAAPLVFRTWLEAMLEAVLADDIPEPFFGWYAAAGYPTPESPMRASLNVQVGTKVLREALREEAAGVEQVYDLLNGRDPQALMLEALATARQRLIEEFGPKRERWRLRVVPQVFFTGNFLGVPQALPNEEMRIGQAYNRGTENDLVALDGEGVRAWEIAAPGQSGFIGPDGSPSPHYADQLALYAQWRRKPMWHGGETVGEHASVRVTLIYQP